MKDIITLGSSEEGSIDLDVNRLVDSRMLIQGNSGGGKSWLLRLLCERAAGKVPIIVLDPEGEFASLREKVDAILIGPDGEVPTDLRSAALLARKLVELQVSAIIDLYELRPHQRREYVKLFLDALVDLPRSLWHPTLIVIDECHKFAPEKGQGESVSTQSVIDLMSLGRKRGYCGIIATQRFSKLHNDVIAETNNVFIGRTWLAADQKRAGDYLGLAAADRKKLRELNRGEFYAFGPALSQGGVVKFRSGQVETTHPKPGQRHTMRPPKASDAIKHIVGQIEDLPQQAEEQVKDMAAATVKIRDLERQLKTRPVEKVPEVKEIEVIKEVMVMPEKAIEALRETIDLFRTEYIGQLERISKGFEALNGQKAIGKIEEAANKITSVVKLPITTAPVRPAARPVAKPPIQHTVLPETPERGDLNKSERLILQAFYWTRDEQATPAKIGFYSSYSHKSGSFSNTLSSLRSRGLLAGYTITPDGAALAAEYAEPKPTGAELREWLRPKLSKCENEILDVLIQNPGVRLDVETIAGQTESQYSYSSGSFSNALSRLRSLDAAEGYGREGLKAADVFFE